MSDDALGDETTEYQTPSLGKVGDDVTFDEWSKQWREGIAYIEANIDRAPVADKLKFNVWDSLQSVCAAVSAALTQAQAGDWVWWRNSNCKYVTIRIDMRSGHCILCDKDGERINPGDLLMQR